MKKTLSLLLCISALFSLNLRADELPFPKFSNDGVDYWYYIQFEATGHVMESKGANEIMRANFPEKGNDAQLWKFLGSEAPEKLTLVNKEGNLKISYTGSNYFKPVAFDTEDEYTYTLARSSHSDEDGVEHVGFEVRRKNATNYQIWQKTGEVGSEIARKSSSDNNPERIVLRFFAEDEMQFSVNHPVEISPNPASPNADGNGDIWYYMQFTDIQDFAVIDTDATSFKSAFPVENKVEQLWKVAYVGIENDVQYYTFTNKNGQCIQFDGTEFTAGASATQFSIKLSDGRGYNLTPKGSDTTLGRTTSEAGPIGQSVVASNSRNIVDFVLSANMMYPSKYFSTADNPVWYYLKFVKSGNVIQDNGSELLLTATAKIDDAKQLWRVNYKNEKSFKITDGVYEFVNKSTGNQITYISGGADGSGFYSTSGPNSASTPIVYDMTLGGTETNEDTGLKGFLLHGNYSTSLSYFGGESRNNGKIMRISSSNAVDLSDCIFVFEAHKQGASVGNVLENKVKLLVNGSSLSVQAENIKQVTVYTLAGQVLQSQNSEFQFNIANNGLYIVTVIFGDNTKKSLKITIP